VAASHGSSSSGRARAGPLAGALADVAATLRAGGCVFAEDEAELLLAAARTPAELAGMVDRRVAGQPLEHILGWATFCALRVSVDPGVFVPRRRTEFLVAQVLTCIDPAEHRPVVVDLCCGTGAVGVALVAAVADLELHAVDVDPAAVRCARRNIGAAGFVYEGDLYAPLPVTLRGAVDVVVANAPYVPSEAVRLLPTEARIHEPRTAIDGGRDGQGILRRVAAGAAGWLAPGGHLLLETGEDQAGQIAGTLAGHGLDPHVTTSDDLDATVVVGTAPSRPAPAAR
jgi:release factor glutamine methyltransferase